MTESVSKMESLNKIIELINSNYQIKFVIEKAVFDDEKTLYRLKRRKHIKILPFFQKKFFDDYETNCVNQKINFKNLDDIKHYLKLQFSEAEGFMTESLDIVTEDGVIQKKQKVEAE